MRITNGIFSDRSARQQHSCMRAAAQPGAPLHHLTEDLEPFHGPNALNV